MVSIQHLAQASPRGFSIEIRCLDNFGIVGPAHFTASPAVPGRQNQPKNLCRKRTPNPWSGKFFSSFWCISPSTSGLTCVIWALLNPSPPTPKFSRPPLSCFYFDSQFNPVNYFCNLLGTFALFSLNGKATGGDTRSICWAGLHSLSSCRFTCQG